MHRGKYSFLTKYTKCNNYITFSQQNNNKRKKFKIKQIYKKVFYFNHLYLHWTVDLMEP